MPFKTSTVQLLGAQALDGGRIAMIVQIDDRFLGGVAFQTDLTYEFGPGMALTSTMTFKWDWWKIVESPEQFYQNREWENPPKQLGYPTDLLITKP